ncbi:MAG: c-type cytochrome biogenesis protein CcmI, partial [Burkholderiales bacterium]
MVLFWTIAGLLTAAAVALIAYPLLSRRVQGGVSSEALNTTLYAEQLREQEADLRAGLITQRDFDAASRELKARLVDDVREPQPPRSTHGGRITAIAVGVAVPLCAIGVYFLVGSPQALGPVPAADPAQELGAEQIEAMVERLAERLKNDSGNVEGWM